MTFSDILIEQLKKYEGFRSTIYKDTVGKWTIGYGRNLSDFGITMEEAEELLQNDMEIAIIAAKELFDSFDILNDARKAVLANMAFNLGKSRLSGFKKLIKAISDGDYQEAAKQMLDSTWANQVGQRATDLAHMMETGA